MRWGDNGLVAQLRRPPGGRDARIMLFGQFLDRTGSGVWGAAAVLYFTFVSHLDGRQVGLLLGVAAVAGIAGSPLAGRLAERLPVRWLLIGCHLLRLGTMCLLLVCESFDALLPVVALTCLGERAAKTLEMLFATRVAGERRTTYQALFRTVANAGYALGAGIAAIGLAVGTEDAYRALILCNALSFVLAAALVWRTHEPSGTERVVARAQQADTTERPEPAPSPWRDRGYLLFVLLDIPMNLDDSVLNVGLPLWLVHRTSAPHAFVPAFLLVNTVLVVVLQLRISAWAEGPRRAAAAVAVYGATMLLCCVVLAIATGGGAWSASIALLGAATLVTVAELMRSVSSWELAVRLAPPQARASYLGVAGMSQSVQKSVGPLLLTGAVLTTGPAGWLVLGTAVAGLGLVQRRACLRRLAALSQPTPATPQWTANTRTASIS
ncbi:MFS transporter [Kitasatospora kifunensis]|uniref:MFS family permease n=1 Tax=Kitasatospora kifunensis TaxID=58351 RepID=A0A7W7R7E0_KITKI|nr:MFS transporter [Kitasatospora kifunensis]MBB4926807.1 MFS family permease [Kitasatospora kifunensis]